MRRVLSFITLLAILSALAGTVLASPPPAQPPATALAYVNVAIDQDLAAFRSTELPAYLPPWGGLSGHILTGADPSGQQALTQAGLTYQILDPDITEGTYYLAYRMATPAPTWSDYGQILLGGGDWALLRTTPAKAERLALAGGELQQITLDPKPLYPPETGQVFPRTITPDPLIQYMMDQVTQDQVYQYDGDLSGEWPVIIGGSPYTIATRNTYSGEPIQKATQFFYEHLEALGMEMEYHEWGGSTYPNVIGEITGLTNPDDIYIICAHIDDMPSSGLAPGADDNASGVVAVMMAADILSQYQWGCTLRFAAWTGEEQGLNGSQAYAQRSAGLGENIVGVLNLDMIAWDELWGPDIDLHANDTMPPTLQLAQVFSDVVDVYNLNLIPQIVPDGTGASDHASFWQYGYTAILGIEDFYPNYHDFNDYYHTSNDLLQYLNMPYFTDFVKASIGTFAHMSGCLIPAGLGALDGYVTAQGSGQPIEGATLTMADPFNHTFYTNTNSSGYYTRTLMANTYTVTASAFGYFSAVTPNVEIITDVITPLDFALTSLPTYVVSGAVTAVGTGAPLDAAVEVLDTPLAPALTDPATGFYSLTVPSGTYTLQATSDGYASEDRVVVADHDQTQDFALYPICAVFTDTVENGNIGWTTGGTPNTWAITTESYHSFNHSWTDSPGVSYQNNANNYIVSPIMDLSDYSGATLSFWHRYDTEAGYDYCNVEYSTDGGSTWSEVTHYDGTITSWEYVELPIPELDDQSNSRIRFHFDSDVYINADGWHIDDIALTAGGPGCAQPTTPVAAFESNAPVCDGQEVAFTNTSFMGYPPADQFQWAFGDGMTSTLEHPTHLYAGPGNYEVSFELCNSVGCDAVTDTVEVLVGPTAIFTFTTNLLTVSFTNNSQAATGYLWAFGDGMTSTLEQPVYTYTTAGAYSVTLTAYGCGEDDHTAVVTVAGVPLAGFTHNAPVCLGKPIVFTNTSANADTFLWTFGDGTTATETHPMHSYTATGTYTVNLEACQDAACDTAQDTVEVLPTPIAAFTWTADLLTVTFTNASQEATTYQWSLGDGGTSTETHPVHTYAAAGTYSVVLTATGVCGEDVVTYDVPVSEQPPAWHIYLPIVIANR